MRSGYYPERTVGRIAIIEMQPNGDHLRQQGHGRLHMGNPILHAPRTEARCLDLAGHSDRQILMPRHEPVGGGSLIEKDGPNRIRVWAEIGCDQRHHWFRVRESMHPRYGEKPARTSTMGIAQHRQQDKPL
jgi:hypothetical protein